MPLFWPERKSVTQLGPSPVGLSVSLSGFFVLNWVICIFLVTYTQNDADGEDDKNSD